MKNRSTINISLEAKSQMDAIKSEGQSYDGIIRELVKFWKDKKGEYWTRRREKKELKIKQGIENNAK